MSLQVSGIMKGDSLTIKVEGRVDSASAPSLKKVLKYLENL